MIKITQSQFLNKTTTQEVLELIEKCQNYESITLSFPEIEDAKPVDEMAYFYFLYHNDNLITALWLIPDSEHYIECTGFTHPNHRQQRYFTRLLEYAIEKLKTILNCQNNTLDLLFLCDGNSPDAIAALTHIGYEYWYSETIMELSLKNHIPTAFSTDLRIEYNPIIDQCQTCDFLQNDSIIGSCELSYWTDCIYLYGFSIIESKRNQGFGRQLLSQLLSHFRIQPISAFKLQVNTLNKAAYHLYESMGFIIVERMNYYD